MSQPIPPSGPTRSHRESYRIWFRDPPWWFRDVVIVAVISLLVLWATMVIDDQRADRDRQITAAATTQGERAENLRFLRDRSSADVAVARPFNGFDLTGQNLAGLSLWNADFQRANLAGTDMTETDLTKADLTFANFQNANMASVTLVDAFGVGAQLTSANLDSANLQGMVAVGAVFVGANLSDAVLTEADLRSAVLRDSNLTSANLEGADLTDADLSGACWNDRTRWPSNHVAPGPYVEGCETEWLQPGGKHYQSRYSEVPDWVGDGPP